MIIAENITYLIGNMKIQNNMDIPEITHLSTLLYFYKEMVPDFSIVRMLTHKHLMI